MRQFYGAFRKLASVGAAAAAPHASVAAHIAVALFPLKLQMMPFSLMIIIAS